MASLGDFSHALDGELIDIDLVTGAQTVLASGLESPNDVAVDANGDWLISDFNGSVLRIDRQTRQTTVLASGLLGASGLAIVPTLNVPEPASALLVVLALAAGCSVHRRRLQGQGRGR